MIYKTVKATGVGEGALVYDYRNGGMTEIYVHPDKYYYINVFGKIPVDDPEMAQYDDIIIESIPCVSIHGDHIPDSQLISVSLDGDMVDDHMLPTDKCIRKLLMIWEVNKL